MSEPLDERAVGVLTRALMEMVRLHYKHRPTARATAQEVLNASAIVVATIIAAARECGDEENARGFFETALNQQLAAYAEDQNAQVVLDTLRGDLQ